MCFYYSINTKKPDDIIKSGLISRDKLVDFPKKLVVNGFEHPFMPVITNNCIGEAEHFQWGFIPNSINKKNKAESFTDRYNTLNAKSETVINSRTFGDAIDNQRCLVLASGFFEWQHVGKQKIPYYISLSNESLFAFAGIWDSWSDEQGQQHFTYSILTTQANELMSQIHNTKKRMPIILPFDQLGLWLSSKINKNNFNHYLKDLQYPELKAHTIKPFVTSLDHEMDHEILEPFDYGTLTECRSNNENQLSFEF
jgi:putative SOS response-associated peptidase YedK